MRRQIPGLHSNHQDPENSLDGLFLVRSRKRCLPMAPAEVLSRAAIHRLGAKNRRFALLLWTALLHRPSLWKLNWFLRDFGYDTELLSRDQVDEKSLLNLQGGVRISHSTVNGRSYQNLDAFAPASEWETPCPAP